MAKALQPYASFIIEDNRVNFYRDEIFPIDSMITDNGQNTFYYIKLHDFCNHKY